MHTSELYQILSRLARNSRPPARPQTFNYIISRYSRPNVNFWNSRARIASFYLYRGSRGARVSFLRRGKDEQHPRSEAEDVPVISLRFDGWFSCRCNSCGYIPGYRCHWPSGAIFQRLAVNDFFRVVSREVGETSRSFMRSFYRSFIARISRLRWTSQKFYDRRSNAGLTCFLF